MLLVADSPVEVLLEPQGPLSPQDAIDSLGGEGFPTVEDRGERVGVQWGGKYVHVIWHHYPGVEAVAAAIEVEEGVFDQACDLGYSEVARAVAGVEGCLDALSALERGGVVVERRKLVVPAFEQLCG